MTEHIMIRTVRLGVRSLLLHKLRSLLTALGVLIGVASVIAMLAIGEGASEQAQEQIRMLGSQNVILRSVKPPDDYVDSNDRQRVITYGITRDDLQRIEESFPGIASIVPLRKLPEEVRFGTESARPEVLATRPTYQESTGRILSEGRFLTEADERGVSNVCVLSYEVARKLFPFSSPLGEKIKIGSDYFTAVGVILPRARLKGDSVGSASEAVGEVFIPLSVGQKWFGDTAVSMRAGSFEAEEVHFHEVVIEVARPQDIPFVAAACRTMLERHHDQEDYEVEVPLELMIRAEETKRIFNWVLGGIAFLSLIVGGIGIMNVMLATVTERTREIGIRRALGAKRRHIMTQFLVETVVLSVGGGLIGILLGVGLSEVVERFAGKPTVINVEAPLLAFFISAGIGIIFGLYPAWRAAKMDPVEALRHE